jgi:hypothetical protein
MGQSPQSLASVFDWLIFQRKTVIEEIGESQPSDQCYQMYKCNLEEISFEITEENFRLYENSQINIYMI